jgi:hypothetical protein
MDTAPRSAFLAGAVQPHERTAMMGFIYLARSSASSVGPIITGILAGKGMLWVAFVTAGSLMIAYDLGILAMFGGHKARCGDDGSDDRIHNEESIRSVKKVERAEAVSAVVDGEKFEPKTESK